MFRPRLRMERLTGLEWNSGHLFEGITGAIFFNSAGMQTLHSRSSGMLRFPAACLVFARLSYEHVDIALAQPQL